MTTGQGLSEERLEVDLLVVGAGMAGMTAACRAALGGARVLCVDRAPKIGGSALLSHSFVWTAETVEGFLAACPECDPVLAPRLVQAYPKVMDWLAEIPIEMGDIAPMLHGRGRPVDLISYFERTRRHVENAGGWVLPNRTVTGLIEDSGSVVGARLLDEAGSVEVTARRTVLATGGFQGNRADLQEYMGDRSRGLTHRSNPYSVGDGLALARSVGADTAGPMDAFYGHLIPWPLLQFGPAEFGRLIMSFSDHAVLLNASGERFVDESLGDHRSNQSVAAQPGSWATLVFDEVVRNAFAARPAAAGMEQVDKLDEALRGGGQVLTSGTVDGLARQLGNWGLPPETVIGSITQYNRLCEGEAVVAAIPRQANRHPLTTTPFYAMRVVPTITFTLGGIRIDGDARVLDGAGLPIGGLYAAGGDIGGVFGRGYAGGLAMSAVFGFIAADGLQ